MHLSETNSLCREVESEGGGCKGVSEILVPAETYGKYIIKE